jgi:hypothetical protein
MSQPELDYELLELMVDDPVQRAQIECNFGRHMNPFLKQEEAFRQSTYDRLHQKIGGLVGIKNGEQVTAYHETYADRAGSTVERRVIIQPMNRIGFGDVLRIIVNDEGPDPEAVDGRRVDMSEYMMQPSRTAIARQVSRAAISQGATHWELSASDGPFIYARRPKLTLYCGPEYSLPVSKYYTGTETGHMASVLVRRYELEEAAFSLNAVISTLSGASYKPDMSFEA